MKPKTQDAIAAALTTPLLLTFIMNILVENMTTAIVYASGFTVLVGAILWVLPAVVSRLLAVAVTSFCFIVTSFGGIFAVAHYMTYGPMSGLVLLLVAGAVMAFATAFIFLGFLLRSSTAPVEPVGGAV